MSGRKASPTPIVDTSDGAARSPSSRHTDSPESGGSPRAVVASPLPAEFWAEAPEDDGLDDGDSGLGVSLAESTASLTSSILNYRTIKGRTYHSEIGNAQYWGANDAGHSQSMDLWHHMITLSQDDKLFMAPVTNPKKVLDIGTGTGIWAIDMADLFPDCEVIGTDVSPIQPTWVPPNLTFEIEDCTQDWSFPDNEFDFIHIRTLVGSIAEWTPLFKEAYRCLKPGGWLESLEMSVVIRAEDGPVDPNTAVGQWAPLFTEGGKVTGRSFTVVEDDVQETSITEAGFEDLQWKLIKLPSGTWPEDPRQKEIGLMTHLSIVQDIEGFILFLSGVLGWPEERVTVFAAHLRKELRGGVGGQRIYTEPKVVWARKPEE